MPSFSPPQIFCKSTLKKHRLRGKNLLSPEDGLVLMVEKNLLTRVQDFKADFSNILALGFRSNIFKNFKESNPSFLISGSPLTENSLTDFVFDEEYIPFASQQFDLILSALHLHAVNDLPGSFVQIFHALKSTGLFMGAFLGGESLKELRAAFFKSETFLRNGISPRFAPQIDIKGAANILKRGGFKTSISESQSTTLLYETPFDVCQHIKALSETNSLLERSKGLTSPSLLREAFRAYETVQNFYPLTFEIIYVTAWRI